MNKKKCPICGTEMKINTSVVCVSADSKVSKLAGRAWVTPINEKQFMQDVHDNFVSGEEVIVQIRKKQ